MSAARTPPRRAINEFLDRLPRLTIVAGKGGVGKTTCAIGIAAHLAARGESTLLMSTDPANALGPVLGVDLTGGAPRAIEAGLSALQLDPIAARQAFLERWREVLVAIVDRGTYLDTEDIGGLVDASMPGGDEIFGLLVLAELLTPRSTRTEGGEWSRLVVDTAPTGHTLRLLALPETFEALIALLEAMQAKHRFMVSALTRRYRRDVADDFLDEMRRTIRGLRESLGDVAYAGAVLVTRAEQIVVSETARYADALRGLGISVLAVVVEALAAGREGDAEDSLRVLRGIGRDGLFAVPRREPQSMGVLAAAESLSTLVDLGAEAGVEVIRQNGKGFRSRRGSHVSLKAGGGRGRDEELSPSPPSLDHLIRTLTIVGGKGGVGKTTVSCALALAAAVDRETLLVSTDPAPSIGDALGFIERRWAQDGPEPIENVPRLMVWQMDATTAFQALRDRYRDRIDALFDSIVGRKVDLAHDRRIIRDLLSLAPPGIDELYALTSLGDALAERRYACIIVDPAPTGHLLRLLQLPALAIEWSHRLMRLILKYREIAGLADAAEDLISFSRRTRALDQLLHDETRAGVVLVSLDEPAVVAETRRLDVLLRSVGIAVIAEVRNRGASDAGAVASPTFIAPELHQPLVGPTSLRDWSRSWQRRDSR